MQSRFCSVTCEGARARGDSTAAVLAGGLVQPLRARPFYVRLQIVHNVPASVWDTEVETG